MHFQQDTSSGSIAAAAEKQRQSSTIAPDALYKSSALPFGQDVPLSFVSGPTYLTAQTLIQQVAYVLSDKIFAYSPETFDLDLSVKKWSKDGEQNAFGYVTGISSLETRAGAGQIALGYIFSKDFDLSKRHIPQTIVASSATLTHLRASLDQLSLLYSVANPVVAHVAAVDYAVNSSTGLVTDYVTPMTVAEELGLGLVASSSSFEAQHMSLFATLLAKDLPTLHVYDGVNVGRETTQVVDVLDASSLRKAYDSITSSNAEDVVSRHADNEGRVTKLVQLFNEELGTDYKLFEFYGHDQPDHVLVVFGSVESSLAAQLAFALSKNGTKIAIVNVRVYRPFVEETFLDVLPTSVQSISVLGQVKDVAAVNDPAEHSRLYADVLAAISFSSKFSSPPAVVDLKYSRDAVWTPRNMLAVLQQAQKPAAEQSLAAAQSSTESAFDLLGPTVKRYSFWDVDASAALFSPTAIAQLLSRESTENVQLRTGYDNLTRGGVVRSDIRCSTKSIEAPYSISSANVTFVGDEKLLSDFDIVSSVREGGRIILRLPGAKEQDQEKLEKRLPEAFRQALALKSIQLFILDPTVSPKAAENPQLESVILPIAFLRVTRDDYVDSIAKLAPNHDSKQLLETLSQELDQTLWLLETPSTWSTLDIQDKAAAARPTDITNNAFVGFDKTETENASALKSSVAAAQGFAFKEALGTQTALRPDLTVKTFTVQVKERRRLTPLSYDRNVFHIEFDLGTSGLTYAIGEALGIHQENDAAEVNKFIEWYGLNATDIVEVPSREDFNVFESRTVYQALMQNIDIFGRPPKRFYEQLAEFASEEKQKKDLLALAGPEGAVEFKRRAEVDTITYADLLLEFTSARPSFHDIVKIVSPLKRREYSIASSQRVTPNSVSLLIVTVNWVDPSGRDRFGQATRYLNDLAVGSPVTVSVKPSVMKLPAKSTAPLIMAGLGTGLAPFRAFVQERAWQKQQGMEIGEVLLFMGSRHQREEYLYGEEWEAYRDAGIITHMGCAFSRDQPQKIYIQDRMRESLTGIRKAYLKDEGSFYLCGPTWPVPDVTEVLQEAVEVDAKLSGQKKVDSRRVIEQLKDDARYVLEVY